MNTDLYFVDQTVRVALNRPRTHWIGLLPDAYATVEIFNDVKHHALPEELA